MNQNGKTIGLILIGGGGLLFLGCSAVSIASSLGAQDGSASGAILGVVLSLFVAVPLVGGGIFLLVKSRSDAAEAEESNRQRKILSMVKTRGQVDLTDLVIELKTSTEQVKNDVYTLVGMGLFTGYINWDKGQLYSQEASQLSGNTCPNCGGEQSFGGKGIITCQYCGTDVFL